MVVFMEKASVVAPGRGDLIAALEKVRESRVVAYVTSTRIGVPQATMSPEDIPVIYEHLRELDLPDKTTKLDLFIHTNGGEATVPWRLMTLLREFSENVNLLVPHRAFSAGTLAALGAEEVIMHPMGVLGPTDTETMGPFHPRDVDGQHLPIQVEDVLSYIEWVKGKDDVGITHEDELVQALGFLTDRVNPLALGNVKRSVLQSRMMGAKLLSIRKTEVEHDAEEIVETLAQRLFYHGHPINRREAHDDLHLTWVVNPDPKVEDAMWALYESFAEEMHLAEAFSPLQEALAKLGKLPDLPTFANKKAEPAPAPTIEEVDLDPLQLVRVETVERAEAREEKLTVTLSRTPTGDLDAFYALTKDAWYRRR
jgi:hypothetical protein